MARLLPRMTITSPYKWMRQLCYDESDDRLLAASEGDVLVWCMRTGALLHRMPALHEAAILAMCYCASSRHVVTSSHGGVMKKWAFSGERIVLIETLHAHTKRVNCLVSAAGGPSPLHRPHLTRPPRAA